MRSFGMSAFALGQLVHRMALVRATAEDRRSPLPSIHTTLESFVETQSDRCPPAKTGLQDSRRSPA
jgi:hypothetical protein